MDALALLSRPEGITPGIESARAVAGAMGQRQPETPVRDILRAIRTAATDSRIERIVGHGRGPSAAGLFGPTPWSWGAHHETCDTRRRS